MKLSFFPLGITTEEVSCIKNWPRIEIKSVDCLSYYTVNEETGEIYEGGSISLDKEWFKPCLPLFKKVWTPLEYDSLSHRYNYPDPDGGTPYHLYKELIDLVDQVVIEQDVFGLNLKLL